MASKKDYSSKVLVFLIALGEALCIVGAFCFALFVARWPELPFFEAAAVQWPWPVVLLICWYFQAIDKRLYLSRRGDALIPQLLDAGRAIFTAALMTLFIMALFKTDGIDRRFTLAFCSSAVFSILLLRLVARLGIWGLHGKGFNYRHIVLVGTNPRTRHLAEVMLSHEHYGYRIVGFLDDDDTRQDFMAPLNLSYRGPIRNLETLITDKVVDVVYVTLPFRSHYETIQDIAHLCEGVGVQVRLVGDLFLAEDAAFEADRLGDIPLLTLRRPAPESRFDLEQFSDWIVCSMLIVFLSPILLILSAALYLEHRGPVFVKEPHLDYQKKKLRNVLRFRTRRPVSPLSESSEPEPTPGHPRQPAGTRLGALLHALSLNELPEMLSYWQNFVHSDDGEDAQRSDFAERPGTANTAGVSNPVPRTSVFRLVTLGVLDGCSLTSAFLWAAWDTLPWNESFGQHLAQHIFYWPIFLVLWYGAAIDQRLFRFQHIPRLQTYLFAITKALGSALVLGAVFIGIFFKGAVDRNFLFEFCIAAPIFILALRLTYRFFTRSLYRHGFQMRKVVIVGANERAVQLASTLTSGKFPEYEISSFVEDDPDRRAMLEALDIPYAGSLDRLQEIIESESLHAIFVCVPARSHYEKIQRIVHWCEAKGIPVSILADLLHVRVAKNQLMYIEDVPMISLSPIPETRFLLFLKRVVDLSISTALLIPLLPAFFTIGLLIKLESKGPIFFLQERIGQNQRRFKMIKFRTMVADAEKLKAKLEAMNEADGPIFKMKKDPRITRIGGFMRKHSIDEFPQLINVWLGEMSLVGPRPPIQAEVDQYTWSQRRRLSVRPGMTGLWQVSGRSDVGFEDLVKLDLLYIDTWSIRQDFIILLKTFKEVFIGRGAV